MDNETVDRAYEIICDRPGITRGQLKVALGISDSSAGRCITTLRDRQNRVVKVGFGNYPASQLGQDGQFGQHRNQNDLAIRSIRSAHGSKGLTSNSVNSVNSNYKHIDSVESEDPRMEDEAQASSGIQDAAGLGRTDEAQAARIQNAAGMNNSNIEVDTLGRSTVISRDEERLLDINITGSGVDAAYSPPIPSELSDVIEDVRVLLTESISKIKSKNQSNGWLVGAGRKKSMVREPWEHLEYAADKLASPKAGIYDVLTGIQCLAHSGVTYESQPIPWDTINENYPAPPPRKITPILIPGPVEEDIEALALEYGYTRVVHTEPQAAAPVPSAQPAPKAEATEPVVVPPVVTAPESPAITHEASQETANPVKVQAATEPAKPTRPTPAPVPRAPLPLEKQAQAALTAAAKPVPSTAVTDKRDAAVLEAFEKLGMGTGGNGKFTLVELGTHLKCPMTSLQNLCAHLASMSSRGLIHHESGNGLYCSMAAPRMPAVAVETQEVAPNASELLESPTAVEESAADDDDPLSTPGLPDAPEFPDVQSLRAQDAQDPSEAAQVAQFVRDALPREEPAETVEGPVTPAQAPVTVIDISSMPPGLSWPEKVVEYVRRGGQDLVAIAAAIDQSLASIQNVVRFHGDIETRYEHGHPHYYVPPTVPEVIQPPAVNIEDALATAAPVTITVSAPPFDDPVVLRRKILECLDARPDRDLLSAAAIHAAVCPIMDVDDLDFLLQRLGCNGEIEMIEMGRGECEFRANEPDEPLDAVEEPAEAPTPVDPDAWLKEPRIPYPAYTHAVDDDDIFSQPYEPFVHEDLATMKARHEQKQQAERDAEHAAAMARLDRDVAQDLADAVEVPATPAPAPEAPTEPVAALAPAGSLAEKIIGHIQQGVRDLPVLAKHAAGTTTP